MTPLSGRTPSQVRAFALQTVSIPGSGFLVVLSIAASFDPQWVRWVVLSGAGAGVLIFALARLRPARATATFVRVTIMATMLLNALIGLAIAPPAIGTVSAFAFIGISVGSCAFLNVRTAMAFSTASTLLGVALIAHRSTVAPVACVIFIAVSTMVVVVVLVLRQSLQAARDEAVMLSLADELTGLANRRSMQLNVPLMSALADRTGQRLGCLVIDLDHFKTVNDTYGHPAGDALLRITAETMQATTRNSDLCVRLGGDEFAVFTVVQGRDELVAVAERLRDAVGVLPMAPHATVSVGGALLAEQPAAAGAAARRARPSLDELLTVADRALYQAKSAGRNFVRIE